MSGFSVAISGLATMALAVLWFFGGLCVGIIFFYPPILFLIGLGIFIKGVLQKSRRAEE